MPHDTRKLRKAHLRLSRLELSLDLVRVLAQIDALCEYRLEHRVVLEALELEPDVVQHVVILKLLRVTC